MVITFYNTPERGLEQSGSSAPRGNGRLTEVPPSLLPGGVCFDGQSRPDWQFQSSSQFGQIALMAAQDDMTSLGFSARHFVVSPTGKVYDARGEFRGLPPC